MMNNPITGYQSLADEDYKMLAYVSSLKGLLKPFKSKGELELLESNRDNGAIDATAYPERQTLSRAPASADIHYRTGTLRRELFALA